MQASILEIIMRLPRPERAFLPILMGLFWAGSPELRAEGHSLRFHGTGRHDVDRVKIPLCESPGLPGEKGLPVDVGATDFTLEFWVRGSLEENRATWIQI